jgi:hypothetical protein
MRRIAIVLCDVGASIVAIEWARIGPWDRMLGFNLYHSRGDVWLPTPPAAAAFFRAMVSIGVLSFAIFFLLASFLIFFLGQSRGASADDQPRGILQRMFYGDARTLLVKYFAILFISFISPFFYNLMWRVPVSHALRIAGGSAMSIAIFIVVLAIAGLRVSHRVMATTGA